MKKTIFFNGLSGFILVFAFLIVLPPAQAEEPLMLVGHLSYLEGELFRYDAEEKGWVAVEKDAPLGKGDVLYTEKEGKAEFLLPNNTWAWIGNDTHVRLVALTEKATEFEITSGVARFSNPSSDAEVAVTTPYGFVTSPAKTSFDVYVHEDSVEVIALQGTVDFYHALDNSHYDVSARFGSLLADRRQVGAGEGRGDSDWVSWNQERERLWAQREQERGETATYLPEALHNEAYTLADHGQWERVYYEGAFYHFWRPLYVYRGWSPFTVGRWHRWRGDYIWMPAEPFGYLTHHYGNWIFTGGFWYWAPPVYGLNIRFHRSLLNIAFGWYPGRVAWIHRYNHIGWIPLAPFEPYYCHHYWGPHTIVVKNVTIFNAKHKHYHYRHKDHAVVVSGHDFYNGHTYQKVRLSKPIHLARDGYQITPLLEGREGNHVKPHRKTARSPRADVFRKSERNISSNRYPQISESDRFRVQSSAISKKNNRIAKGYWHDQRSEEPDRQLPKRAPRGIVFQGKTVGQQLEDNRAIEINTTRMRTIKSFRKDSDYSRNNKQAGDSRMNNAGSFPRSVWQNPDIRPQRQIQMEQTKSAQQKMLREQSSRNWSSSGQSSRMSLVSEPASYRNRTSVRGGMMRDSGRSFTRGDRHGGFSSRASRKH